MCNLLGFFYHSINTIIVIFIPNMVTQLDLVTYFFVATAVNLELLLVASLPHIQTAFSISQPPSCQPVPHAKSASR
jgi:hypothetical protein